MVNNWYMTNKNRRKLDNWKHVANPFRDGLNRTHESGDDLGMVFGKGFM
jgi:hypothetical protein